MKRAFIVTSMTVLFLAPLAAQSIIVTSPAAGAQWCQGTGYAITWTSAGVSGPVAIKLRMANAPDAPPVLDIVASMGNAGTYTWTVPASVPAGSYVVRVRTVSDAPLVYDDSDAFTIKACQPPVGSITVTAPAPGAEWCQGSGYAITWMSSDVAGPMSIQLYQAGVPNAPPALEIAASAANSGSFSWTIPASLAPGNYLIRVRTVSDSPLVYGDSAVFAVKPRAPVVVSMPSREAPPPVVVFGKPRLEVSGIDLAPNADGFGIVFSYRNAGNGPLPKASEVPVKPSYRVLIDGKETASGSLFIPAFAAQPGWEQWGYFGGWIVLPSASDALNGNWHIGETVTVHINENGALGMPSHSLALPLKPIALKYKYDLGYTDVRLDWKNRIVTISLRLDGNVPPGRNLELYCGNTAGSGSNFKVKQPARAGSHVFSGEVKNLNPLSTSSIDIFILIFVVNPDTSHVGDMDYRNNSQYVFHFASPNPYPVQ